ARKQSHAPFRVVQTSRTSDELFYFAGKLTAQSGMSFHQFAALVIRERIPIALFTAALAHIIKANYRPIGQRGIYPLLPVMFHSVAKRMHRFGELLRVQLDVLLLLERLRVIFLCRDVFTFLSE